MTGITNLFSLVHVRVRRLLRQRIVSTEADDLLTRIAKLLRPRPRAATRNNSSMGLVKKKSRRNDVTKNLEPQRRDRVLFRDSWICEDRSPELDCSSQGQSLAPLPVDASFVPRTRKLSERISERILPRSMISIEKCSVRERERERQPFPSISNLCTLWLCRAGRCHNSN